MPPVVVVEGVGRLLKASGKARADTAVRIADGLRKCAEIILEKSQQLVPIATGDLKSTGQIGSEGQGFGAQAWVQYGGVGASGKIVDYASFVHEDAEAQHAPPTTYRFLSKAILATRGTCTAVLKRQLQVEQIWNPPRPPTSSPGT
jgi:hypothetical protein